MKLLALLLAPVSRIHAYLSHIQVSRDCFGSADSERHTEPKLMSNSGSLIF